MTKRILALETCGATGSLAALAGDKLLVELTLQHEMATSRALAPMMRDLLKRVAWEAKDVDLVGVASGPGSFTGLRIGLTTAKTFAYAVGADIVAVNSLEVIATQAPTHLESLVAVMDAHRGELFAGEFVRTGGGCFKWVGATELVAAETWLETLRPGIVVSGPVLARLKKLLPPGVMSVDAELWAPSASGVGMLAWRRYEVGARDDLWSLVPEYFRKSAAEEKLNR